MLVLSRMVNERIVITSPDGIRMSLVIVEIRGNKVRLGIDAPRDYSVNREEVQEVIDLEHAQ